MNLTHRAPLDISEAARKPSVVPPVVAQAARAGRTGYQEGIPLGGATETNPTTLGSSNRDDQMQQLLEAYIACPWVSACIDVTARTCTAGGIQVVPNSKDLDDPKIPKPPPEVQAVQDLMSWINPEDDSRQVFRCLITDLLIFGDAFTEVVYMQGKPVALYPLPPQSMTVLATEHGTVTGYYQSVENGKDCHFEPNEVIHVRLDAPGFTGLYGVSPTQKTLLSIEAWLFTIALVKETMKRGDPLRAHVDWNIALPESERIRFSDQYRRRNVGAKNIGTLFETKGGAQVTELGINQINNWLSTIQQRRDEIVSGFGIPPSKVGIVEAGNIGGGTGSSQERAFNVNVCGPLQELVLEKFTSRLLVQCWGISGWHLEFGSVDWRDDETIETIRDLRIRNGAWTLNRLRSDIGEPPTAGGDAPVLIDRQNMVLWSDLQALSNANIQAIKAKAITPAPQMSGLPGAPAPSTSESWDDPNSFLTAFHARRARLKELLP